MDVTDQTANVPQRIALLRLTLPSFDCIKIGADRVAPSVRIGFVATVHIAAGGDRQVAMRNEELEVSFRGIL